MFRPLQTLAGLGFALVALAMPAVAAEDTTVKVALLDISAIAPDEPVIGMMGQTVSPGMVSPGLLGRGVFGPGAMGMMSIRLDKAAVKAGQVTFDVTNWSRGMVHEMLVVAVVGTNAALPYDYATGKVMEDQIKSLGDTGEMQPNESKTLTLSLAPGTYMLFCNVAGHYAAGMAVPFTVAP